MTESEIREIVEQKIRSVVEPGEQTGSSGHLGFVEFRVDSLAINPMDRGRVKVDYTYTVFIETEFTYYPDNPPHEYKYGQSIVIDRNRRIVEESEREILDGTGFDW
jgi:hypothetical protein